MTSHNIVNPIQKREHRTNHIPTGPTLTQQNPWCKAESTAPGPHFTNPDGCMVAAPELKSDNHACFCLRLLIRWCNPGRPFASGVGIPAPTFSVVAGFIQLKQSDKETSDMRGIGSHTHRITGLQPQLSSGEIKSTVVFFW
jgi:hypothetical protein